MVLVYDGRETGLGVSNHPQAAGLQGGSMTLRAASGEGAQLTLPLPLHTT